ncbi:MAG: hypothetical protein P8J86_11080 [Phycisphaerales bacterium]|nr:hypothetical protein [Phycisphaerales bacterium]
MNDTDQSSYSQVLRWALQDSSDSAMASANWLASDIDSGHDSVEALLDDPKAPLSNIQQAKGVFKTMRVVGETTADRRLGARLYAATIASALVHHKEQISTQSDAAITRSLTALADDRKMPSRLRRLAREALSGLQ